MHTVTQPVFFWLTARAIGASSRAFVASIRGIFEAGILMFASVLLARIVLLDLGFGPGARLGILIGLGVTVYLAFVSLRAPDVISELRSVRRPPSAASASLDAASEAGG
jgi:uncharacterized protein involved in response to NO